MRITVRFGAAIALAAAGCGSGDGRSDEPEQAVRAWSDAINERDWEGACAFEPGPGEGCEARLRADYGDDQLTFTGPAVNGAGTKPNEAYFSLEGREGSTLFVTAVRLGDRFVIRTEAVVERAPD